MYKHHDYDAVVVGAGPNGLAAAITLARQGLSVLLIEGKETVGGGMRSAELTLPGFRHDICSAIHPMGVGSPFFRSLPLSDYGLEWIYAPAELAHPLDDGSAVLVTRSIEETSQRLGADAAVYRRLMGWLTGNWEELAHEFLGPLRLPRHPLVMARFGIYAIQSAYGLARRSFKEARTRAMFAGMAGHSIMALEKPTTAAFGLVLTLFAHAVGWPLAQGGSQSIADALAAFFQSLGGQIITGRLAASIDDLPPARVTLLDVTPRQLRQMAGHRLPPRYKRQLAAYRYGPGVFKVDYALSEPIPWRAADCRLAPTVHVGGTFDEIALAERQAFYGRHPDRPFVLLAQQSLFDPSRAPAGKQTAWAYCHVPNGSTVDMTDAIEAQIERFAPGFRDCILARHTWNTAEMQQYNPNYIGGDINGGVQDLRQLFTRPVPRLVPYATPIDGLYLCSSSTPPGGGVHGMCGLFAARAALRHSFGC